MRYECSRSKEAQMIADKVTKALTGARLWGVEFFLADDGVYFSELAKTA